MKRTPLGSVAPTLLRRKTACWILVLSLWTTSAQAFKAPEVPEYLFHWLTPASLERLAEGLNAGSAVPLKKVSSDFLLGKSYPSLQGTPALFTWSNLATGMGFSLAAGTKEFYAVGDPARDLPARLLVLRPKKSAKVYALRTGVGQKRELPAEAKKADLIYHVHFIRSGDSSVVHVREWVVMNRASIETYTADPREIQSLIEDEIQRLKDPAFKYPDEMIHSRGLSINNDAYRNQVYLPILESVIRGGHREIPAPFLRALPRLSDY
jgi:hypothetical protein